MSRYDIASVPLLPITVCFSFGIILYVYGWGLVSSVILLLAATFFAFRNTYFSTLALAGVLGLFLAYINIPLVADTSLAGRRYAFSGTITEMSVSDAVQTLTVDLDSAGNSPHNISPITQTKLSVIYPDFIPEFTVGEKIVFKATPEIITATYDLPDETDPAEFLIKKHIWLRAYVTSDSIYSIEKPSGIAGFISRCRSGIIDVINKSDLTSSSKELLTAMTTGDSSGLDDETRKTFTSAGIAHILAISGLHVGIITFIVSIALWPLYALGQSNLRWILVCVLIWLFALITGLAPSVVRAAIMASTYILSRILQRNSSPLNSLCLAALIILLLNPNALFQIGFQLSFAAVAATLIFAKKLNPVSPRSRITYNLISYITVSISAMLGTAIISVFHFHSFPVYFLFSNILITMILPFFLCAGILMIVLGAIGIEIAFIDSFINLISGLITGTSEFISNLPGSSIDGIYLPAWLIIPYLCLLICLKLAIDKPDRKKLLLISSLLITVVVIIALIPSTKIEDRIYLARNLRHTELIYCDSVPALRIITNTPNEPINVTERAAQRYEDFISKRGIKSIIVDTARRDFDRMISVGNTRIALLSGKKMTFSRQKINYVIVAKGYRDKMEDIIQSYRPDTIIIASDIHPRRAKRYILECESLQQPFIWARNNSWSFGYDSSLNPIVK